MKIKKTSTLVVLVFFFLCSNLFAFTVDFESSNIEIKDDGNIIFATDSTTKIPEKKLEISARKVEYYKDQNLLIFKNDVIFKDYNNETIIEGNEIKYDKIEDLIYSYGEVKFFVKEQYTIDSKDVFYYRKKNKIYSDKKSIIKDNDQNKIELFDEFSFNLDTEILKSKKSLITDNKKNKYFFEDLVLNSKTNEIIGKEIKIDFNNKYFGNINNDPKLKGRSFYSNDEELELYKAVFSTCNVKNKKCRGWELNSDEFVHDKKNKIFEYKRSWLKIFGVKLFYLPYFNHPDPTVKRKSGFLTPSYSNSETLGTSVNLPYFKVIDIDKDLTFSPRIYADKNFLFQNEYRQALEKSNLLSDFSFLLGNTGTKGHFFYNQVGDLNNKSNYELNVQTVKGDNYLKTYKLVDTSNLIKNDSLLLSNFDVDWKLEESSLQTSFKIYEDLSRSDNDRYQYIFPDFNFSKNINIPENYNGNFNFNSYGYYKNYETNVDEAVITNDFLFSSKEFIQSNGISSNYELLLKNTNDYSKNSSNFNENTNYNLFGTLKMDTSLPLQKKMDNYTHYLKPVASLRFSPNGNTNLSAKDVILNYDNVFNLNRIGSTSEVEGGESISLGIEFARKDNQGFNILDLKVANVIKTKKNNKLPSKSKLNQTRSDIFGNFSYNFSEYSKLEYYFSYDRDLEYSNLEKINLDLSVNNFYTTFSYYTEDNDLGSEENIKNKSVYNINEENNLNFEISKSLKDDFTQYYNLIYSYTTDCISISVNYNKSFYRDGNLEPNKSISFLIKIIPFTELGVPGIDNLIRN